jgi:hypothetical protein
MDGIFSATISNIDDEASGYHMYGNPSGSSDTVIATENPIHSLAGMLNAVTLRPTSTRPQESVRLNPFAARSHADEASDAAGTAVEDDAALYLEYQTLHENHDEALYALDGDSEVAVSFEEWKSERKQFRQGTLTYTCFYLLTLIYSLTHRYPRLVCQSIPSVRGAGTARIRATRAGDVI